MGGRKKLGAAGFFAGEKLPQATHCLLRYDPKLMLLRLLILICHASTVKYSTVMPIVVFDVFILTYAWPFLFLTTLPSLFHTRFLTTPPILTIQAYGFFKYPHTCRDPSP